MLESKEFINGKIRKAEKMYIKTWAFVLLIVLSFIFPLSESSGFTRVSIGPQEAKIISSIKYSVIGLYRAEFEQFSGNITINQDSKELQSVDLNISVASLKSNCSWCDKIVRSKQLLSVEEFPQIIFLSHEIVKGVEGYMVKGVLSLHGQSKVISFPFESNRSQETETGITRLTVKGQWLINRKDFNILWNRVLDKGGVLVGDFITVDWEIVMPQLN